VHYDFVPYISSLSHIVFHASPENQLALFLNSKHTGISPTLLLLLLSISFTITTAITTIIIIIPLLICQTHRTPPHCFSTKTQLLTLNSPINPTNHSRVCNINTPKIPAKLNHHLILIIRSHCAHPKHFPSPIARSRTVAHKESKPASTTKADSQQHFHQHVSPATTPLCHNSIWCKASKPENHYTPAAAFCAFWSLRGRSRPPRSVAQDTRNICRRRCTRR
jgi:hypothetical protein